MKPMFSFPLSCLVFSHLRESVLWCLISVWGEILLSLLSHRPLLLSLLGSPLLVSSAIGLQTSDILLGFFQSLTPPFHLGSPWCPMFKLPDSLPGSLVSSAEEQYFPPVTVFWISVICLIPSYDVSL